MSGKHRKSPSRSTSRRRAPGVPALALGVAGLTTAVVAGQNAATESVPVDLMALITPANSTAQIFASSDYYNHDWSQYGSPQVVPFFLGPRGIADAIDANSADPAGVVVLASGWGAGQTGTALANMKAANDAALNNVPLVVLDNNTNRAGGGFWTTYSMFAPLLGTSAAPTPDELGVPVVDTAYEYNINSDAPTYPINLLADVNSLMAYIYDYGGQATAPMPPEILQDPATTAGQHYVVAPDGTFTKAYVGGTTTYVTFRSDGLPLLRPLRMIPGGDILADAVEPTATALVNAGYQDNSPIPADPRVQRPARLLPPAANNVSQPLSVAAQRSAVKARTEPSSPVAALAQLGTGTGSGTAPSAVTPNSTPEAKRAGSPKSTTSGTAGGSRNVAPHRASRATAS